ncbi:uncharacterized protein MONBRDRAFT_33032 [Monosiga brevicollis MX1]|uniref:Eukaryotic translation initiation factor 4E n=1 Tax=Monosiga brevicollis TaxID=81824 RepID=A9V342_MONBE|nr:uncharacterized protein MONBRDRAFT_33032 [Monosiga brevicollis MX1]EDQ87995.1 predicted protein [Monosiga brevicollis MX1]|eukprot:XP_001747071.1 hypothetical protein [Monosiga brevicollis MX1]
MAAAPSEAGPDKHPLQDEWTLWHDDTSKVRDGDWKSNIKKVCTVNSVEEFWRLFNNIKSFETLVKGSNYHLFKKNIEPSWEDKANANGGAFNMQCEGERFRPHDLWLRTMLSVIGNQYGEDGKYICGVSAKAKRRGERLEMWLNHCDMDDEIAKRIGKRWKELVESTQMIQFKKHNDALAAPGTSYSIKNAFAV